MKWTLVALCFVLAGCARRAPFRSIMPDSCRIEEGDIVFRRGGGLTSHAVVAADAGGNYSHLGIVVDSAGVKMIVHAVPGEPDFEGDEDRVKMDRPERFFSSELTTIGEVRRPLDAATGQRAARVALALYRRGILFDHDYDDRDSSRMYCTELVAYAYRRAGREIVGPQRHSVRLPMFTAECIFPSDIHESTFFQSIYMFNN